MTCVYVAVWPCHCETTPWCHSRQYTGTIPPKVLTHLWIISLSHPTTPALVRTTPAFCCLINNGAIVFDICQIEYAWYLRHTETTSYTYFLIALICLPSLNMWHLACIFCEQEHISRPVLPSFSLHITPHILMNDSAITAVSLLRTCPATPEEVRTVAIILVGECVASNLGRCNEKW